MPALNTSIISTLRPSRLTLESVAAGALARVAMGTLTGLALAMLTSQAALAAEDKTWLSRDIPPVIEELLREEQELQGLFSPRLIPDTRLSLPAGTRQDLSNKTTSPALQQSAVQTPGLSAPRNSDTAMPSPLPTDAAIDAWPGLDADLSADLPVLPENILRQAPAELGRIAAPASERKGVPEPVFLKEMWTFSTPVDRITPLKNEFSANGRFVHDLPSTLTRFDHLSAESLPTDHWIESARLQRLPPEALYAVALQESGMRTASGQIQPWPWTLNCNAPCPHGPMRFASKQAASDALEKLLKAGWRNIDIGAMQVNYRAHAKRFASYDLLDPRINVIVGGVILREAVQQAGGNLRAGFGLYHVGVLQSDNASRAQNYANGVMRWAGRLKQPGALSLARR